MSNIVLLRCGAMSALLVSALVFAPSVSLAQWKPERQVEFVIGTGPGGGLDRSARVIQRIWKETGIVPVSAQVVNRPGAGQALALAYLNDKAGDGHFLTVVSGIIFSNHLTGRTTHAYTDFTPVCVLFGEETVFAVNAASPARNAGAFLDLLKKDPHGMSFAVGSALGSTTHIASALAVKAMGGDVRKMRAVVLASSGDSVTQVLGGHIDVVVSSATLVLPQAQAGKLRILAAASARRLAALPEIPTLKELGVDAVVPNWRGVFGPRGMSAEQVAYWESAFARTVKTPEWQGEAARSLWEDSFMTGREARRFFDADHAATKANLAELGLVK